MSQFATERSRAFSRAARHMDDDAYEHARQIHSLDVVQILLTEADLSSRKKLANRCAEAYGFQIPFPEINHWRGEDE